MGVSGRDLSNMPFDELCSEATVLLVAKVNMLVIVVLGTESDDDRW